MNKEHPSARRDEMFFRIESWQQSGKTQKQFYAEVSVPYCVFQYWLRKFRVDRTETISGDFTKLTIEGSSPQMEIVYPNGVILRLPPGIDPRMIRTYLAY